MIISKLITELEKIKKTDGDLEVWVSADSEGNGYAKLEEMFAIDDYLTGYKTLTLYPDHETIQI